MFEHLPYPKIDTREPDGATSATWVATEKIHGANLVVATDGSTTRIGKRKAWLEADEPFFGWQLLRPELTAAALAIHRQLGAEGIVRIYGELFGGAYPHDEVAPTPGVSAIQTGVWYAPDVRFATFDVLVAGEFLAHHEVESLAAGTQLATVPVLGRGRKAELDRLPVRYPTRVPQMLQLPAILDNVAEGYVLKTDVRCPPHQRATLKRKISEFDEQRFDASNAFDPHQPMTLADFCTLAERMVNAPRVDSARSKIGDEAHEALQNEIVLDVLVDLETTFPAAYLRLGDDEDTLRAAVVSQTRRWLQ